MQALVAILYREYRIQITNMVWIFFDLFLPLGYLLIFGVGFNQLIRGQVVWAGEELTYNSFFLGGILAMAGFGSASGTAWAFFTDRDNGIFYEILTYPLGRAQFQFGRVLFNMFISLLRTILCTAAAVVVLDVPVRWELLPWLLLGTAIGTAGWFFFFSIFALRIRRNDVFNTVMNLFYFFLMFASSMFYPLEAMPGWMQALAWANPVTWHADFLRYATLGIGEGQQLLAEAVLFCAFALISFWAATRTLQRQE